MPHQNGMLTFEELRNIQEPELIQRIDGQFSDTSLTQVGVLVAQIYRDELVRRSQDKATRRMICLTWAITILTVMMFIGLIVQIWLAWKC